MIHLHNLSKSYWRGGREIRALASVDLELEPGFIYFVVGPSGSGKSTLLYLLGALDRPDEGSIEIEGRDLTAISQRDLDEFRRERVGFIFQNFNLLPHLSALENVLVPLIPTGKHKEKRAEAREMLVRFGLENRLDHRPSELSGGEQQRVAIARAILKKPQFLLADEPTGELDSKTGEDIYELLRQLNREQGMTLLVVTHDLRYIRSQDRIFRLLDGKLEEQKKNE